VNNPPSIQAVAAYTSVPWASAMAVLRLAGPLRQAGITLLQGNQGPSVSAEAVSQADVVVIQRDFPRMGLLCDAVIEQARRQGKPVIYEMDDLLLAVPAENPNRADYQSALLPMLRLAITADAVTASTPALCQALRPLNPNTWLLPNYLDDSLWPLNPPPAQAEQAPIVIGYMGGETHRPDMEEITPALLRVLERHGANVRLRFWGGQPPQALLDLPQVEWIAYNQNDYAVFAAFFSAQRADLFIAPLRDTSFNRCKSAIKFLEYSHKGLPGVYSRLPMYQAVIQDGQNGFLASDLSEWEDRLEQLIASPALRREMGQRAQQTVTQDWLLSSHCDEWRAAYQQAISLPPRPPLSPDDWRSLVLSVAQQTEAYLNGLEAQARSSPSPALPASAMLIDRNSRTGKLLTTFQSLRQRLSGRSRL